MVVHIIITLQFRIFFRCNQSLIFLNIERGALELKLPRWAFLQVKLQLSQVQEKKAFDCSEDKFLS